MQMWIGLLGPLDVRDQHGSLAVPAAKQRSLLAALALRAGDVIPADRLAEAVWGSALPASWQSTIRNYIKRLRLALGPVAGGRVLTRSPGYLLAASQDEVDTFAFEAACKAGRAAVRVGDWLRASALLADADGLWRGTPLVDVPAWHLHDGHVRYLEELRLAAIEMRVDADLHLAPSRAGEVIPELLLHTRRHPERERLHTLLMLALYRTGRLADALKAYADARRYSVDELGVDPGPELQQMHRRILTGDQRLLDTA